MTFFQSSSITQVVCSIGNTRKDDIFRVFPIFQILIISSPPNLPTCLMLVDECQDYYENQIVGSSANNLMGIFCQI